MVQESYQHSGAMHRASSSRESVNYYRRSGVIATALLAVGACYFFISSEDQPAPTGSRLSSIDFDMLGSSKHHGKKHHGKDVFLGDESTTQAVVGLQLPGYPSPSLQVQYAQDLAKIDFEAVEQDLQDMLTTSQDWWPADYGNYGGLFIRLAWHSCGSYRTSDGRGGCDGGAQRFDPERSWPDNTNLDKARRLLEPIKLKYGNGLSWGDLFALTGTVAIKSMGGPDPGFCAGRMDVVDNSQTIALGPSEAQDKFGHCEVNGQCPYPLGSNTLGLIYVNPEGPMGEPDLAGAAATIRDVFGRMDWEGREVVALIGGGHTFGKTHGASMESNGEPPNKCPFASWDGPVGVDAITSGLEGPWTSEPTKWDNNYFKYLVDLEWEPVKGPGGKWQWRVNDGNGPQAPVADPHSNATQDVMMLTTDVALVMDPEYRVYVEEFASDEKALKEAFGKAWYKLVTRDRGPVSRCAGLVSHCPFLFLIILKLFLNSLSLSQLQPPKALRFQHPLPPPSRKLAKMDDVAHHLHKLIHRHPEGEFIRLAFQCASTFRATDYQGGCNGARIRFPPGSEWPINAGLDATLELLDPIKEKYGETLSYADLIVLTGNVAAELAGSPTLKFCPGRTDAEDGSGWNHVGYGNTDPPETVDQMIELYERRGQTARDFVALTFVRFRSAKNLNKILEKTISDDLLVKGLQFYPELRYWAEHYVSTGSEEYGNDFATAWTKLMNADRFDGPVGNMCGQ
jgi:catalase-peroxidase